MPDLGIIIPVLNEEGTVEKLVKRIDSAMSVARIKYEIIFVDDHSTDKTVKRIKSLQNKYPIVLHKKRGKKGKAYSILEGVRKTQSQVLAMIDGDLQYPPEAIPEMFLMAREHGVVVANRRKEQISRLRKIGSDASSGLVGKLLLGLNCDAQSGLKVFRREIIEEISEADVKPWSLDMPLLYTARALGETIGTVEIDFAKRNVGQSKVKFFKTASQIIFTALKLKFRGKRTIALKSSNGTMLGAGVAHKRKKFITHTTLRHEDSALFTLKGWQKWFVLIALSLLIAGLLFRPYLTFVGLIAVLSAIYFLDVVFSGYVLLKSLHFPPELKFGRRALRELDKKKLPVYSILCPLYKEGKVLPAFLESIKKIDWPKNKLDVLILLEEDDKETLNVAKSLDLPKYVRVLVVPDSQPRTKPKACNYGLAHARGEYLVVYDAEDRPDPEQLKKAYLGFLQLGEKTFCLQSKLNYFNSTDNFLTRLFTAEYSLWFDIVLPGLQSIESTIPLGGTSNHFRTANLVALEAWDPFNVTEDCDLGIRIFKAGYKTAIIDSTTYEEANSSVKNWVRQRSRWIKGYMQTYLVHMREPIKFFRTQGIHALIFQLIIGMRMTFMLINPFLWIMTIVYFAMRSTLGAAIESLYPAPVFYMAAFALVTGNFMYIYNYMIGCAKRGHYGLIKFVFLVPLYWVIASIAAFKAVYQLITKPHFWEKTNHGLSLGADAKVVKAISTANIGYYSPVPNFARIRNLANSGFSSAALLVIAALVSNGLNLVISVYFGRNLSVEEFGLIALMSSLLFFTQLPASGIYQTLSFKSAFLFGKYGSPVGELWSVYRKRLTRISLLLVAVWLLLVPAMAGFFRADTLIPFVVFAPVWTFVIVGALDTGYLQGNQKFHLYAIVIIAEAVAKLFLSVLFVQLGLAQWVYLALPLASGVSLLSSWVFARRVSGANIGNIEKENDLASSLKFPAKFFTASVLTGLSSISLLSMDVIFVKHFLSPVDAGHYALLVLVGRMIYLIGGLFSQFIMPIISKRAGEGQEGNRAFVKLFLAVLLSTSFVFIFVGPLGGFFVPLVFGEKTVGITQYLVPFGLSMILFSLGDSLVSFHRAKNRNMFVIPGVLTVGFLGGGLYLFHADIKQVVEVMAASGIFFLSSAVTLHIFRERLTVVISNVEDFIGLFLLRLNGKKPLPVGSLRILFFNWRDIKHVWAGGAEVYVHELSKRWVKEGHKVTLFCGNDGKNRRNEEIDGIKIIRRGGFYTVYLWAALYYIFRFRKRYDVVVESENGVPFFTPLYSTKPKILIVHHVHQEVFRNHLKFPLSVIARFIESKLMPLIYKGKAIVAVSESTKQDLVGMHFATSENVNVVTPGIDSSFFKPAKKTNYPSFVYVGRHKAYKNIDVAINAFKIALKSFPSAKLIIAGEGEASGGLKALVRKLRLGKSVKFTGKVSESEKIKLLGAAWAAVQPSSFEGWGITVIEANAAGTPVIASAVSGLTDSVVDGETGILVPAKNTDLFARAMVSIAEDVNLREALSLSASKWARQFEWQGKSDEFIKVIQETVLSKSTAASPVAEVITTNQYE